MYSNNTINTDSALTLLKNLNNQQAEYVIGVTQKNLVKNYSNRKKKKLLGYSELNGHVSVISTYEVSKWKYAEINFYLRMKKILMHELGHNLGLEHCTSNNICIMHEQAGSVKNLDREDIIYCNDCRQKLFTNTPYSLLY
ncbi:MAG: matrixin family metalloprotease [Flavobacteriales bacterium]|nr:matrixin family metalloprotease [Flavobacteriales bacterium]